MSTKNNERFKKPHPKDMRLETHKISVAIEFLEERAQYGCFSKREPELQLKCRCMEVFKRGSRDCLLTRPM
jgi:hypothetical protein